MITLPWQIVAAFVALFGLYMILNFLKRANCDEKIELAKRQTQRDTMHTYRETFQAAWREASEDASKLRGKK